MQALAEKIEKQEKIKEATQQAFLAQAELDGVRERFAVAIQQLDALGEQQAWIRETFGLTASQLRSLLTLTTDHGSDDDTTDDNEATDTDEQHSGDDSGNDQQVGEQDVQ